MVQRRASQRRESVRRASQIIETERQSKVLSTPSPPVESIGQPQVAALTTTCEDEVSERSDETEHSKDEGGEACMDRVPTSGSKGPGRSFKMGDNNSLVEYDDEIDLDAVPDNDRPNTGMGGEYIKSLVFGGLDGIVSTFALVAGLGGAEVKLTTLIAVGLAKVLSDAFSMGFGEFTSATAELEHAGMIKNWEDAALDKNEDGEIKYMVGLYMDQGVSQENALTILTCMAEERALFVENIMSMEHGLLPPEDDERWAPLKQGLVCFLAFVLFGMVPLIGFIMVYLIDPDAGKDDNPVKVLGIACGLTLIMLFIMGVTKAKLTGSPKVLKSGLMMVTNGTIAGGLAYLVGEILTQLF